MPAKKRHSQNCEFQLPITSFITTIHLVEIKLQQKKFNRNSNAALHLTCPGMNIMLPKN